MEPYIARTIEAYNDTQTYENSTRAMVPKAEIDQLLAMLPGNALILDAGCAFGRDVAYMQSKNYSVRGIDLSPAFISRAQELLPDADFQVKDVRETGFSDEQFDGIWCNAALPHLNDTDIAAALAEFYRILKPGGILAASFKKGSGTRQFIDTFSSKSERFFNFQTHESFLVHLTTAGLVEVAWHYVNERERFGPDKRDLDWLYSFSARPPLPTRPE